MGELKRVGDLVMIRRELRTWGTYRNDLFLVLEMKENEWSYHAHAVLWNIMKGEKFEFYCMDLELLQRRK